MARAEDLISYISPSIRIPGGLAISMAVQMMEKLLQQGRGLDEIHMSAEIYTPIAQKTGKSRQTVSKAMERVADCFWMNGQNDNLNRIIGRTLPAKPYHKSAALIFGK